MIVLLLILLGLCLGSFVNAFVWRLHVRKDWVNDRSECTHCHHKLGPADLVPVISWVALRGKCRYCGKPIEDSPLVELAVATVFVLSYISWPLTLHGAGLFTFCLWLVFVVGFAALAVYDLRWMLLPDKVVFPLIALASMQVIALSLLYHEPWASAGWAAGGAVIISGFFYALYAISKGTWIGFGDVKLGIILGLLAGGPIAALLLLFIASVLGMLGALPQIIAGKAGRKSHIPFGPFLILAAVIVQLWGAVLIDWYLNQIVL